MYKSRNYTLWYTLYDTLTHTRVTKGGQQMQWLQHSTVLRALSSWFLRHSPPTMVNRVKQSPLGVIMCDNKGLLWASFHMRAPKKRHLKVEEEITNQVTWRSSVGYLLPKNGRVTGCLLGWCTQRDMPLVKTWCPGKAEWMACLDFFQQVYPGHHSQQVEKTPRWSRTFEIMLNWPGHHLKPRIQNCSV